MTQWLDAAGVGRMIGHTALSDEITRWTERQRKAAAAAKQPEAPAPAKKKGRAK